MQFDRICRDTPPGVSAIPAFFGHPGRGVPTPRKEGRIFMKDKGRFSVLMVKDTEPSPVFDTLFLGVRFFDICSAKQVVYADSIKIGQLFGTFQWQRAFSPFVLGI